MHSLYLGRLVISDVGRKFEEHRIVSGSRQLQQFFDHPHRAFMVRDHQRKKHAVERGAFRRREFGHLFRCRHASHRVSGMHRVVCRRVRHRLATRA